MVPDGFKQWGQYYKVLDQSFCIRKGKLSERHITWALLEQEKQIKDSELANEQISAEKYWQQEAKQKYQHIIV